MEIDRVQWSLRILLGRPLSVIALIVDLSTKRRRLERNLTRFLTAGNAIMSVEFMPLTLYSASGKRDQYSVGIVYQPLQTTSHLWDVSEECCRELI